MPVSAFCPNGKHHSIHQPQCVICAYEDMQSAADAADKRNDDQKRLNDDCQRAYMRVKSRLRETLCFVIHYPYKYEEILKMITDLYEGM
jgi:hypothetical protein